jgi:cold shock CspA family protein
MPSQIICFVAMFLDEPHSTHRYYGELLASYRPRLFQESHRLLPYFVAGVSLAAIERLFSLGQLNRSLKVMKHQLLMVFRMLCGKGALPSIASKRIDGYCDALLEVLDDEARSRDAFQRSAQLIEDTLKTVGSTQDPPQRTRSFTNALIEAAAASREPIKVLPPFRTGTVKWFSEIKGYGFITGDNKKEIFVHITGLLAGPSSTLIPGQRVRYIMGQTDRGERAIEVDFERSDSTSPY